MLLPKNCTAKLKPCNQGVIRRMKAHFISKLRKLLLYKEAKDGTLHQSLLMSRSALASHVDSSVIRNAWASEGMILNQPQSVDDASFTPIDESVEELAGIEDKEPVAAPTDTDIDTLLMCQKDSESTDSDDREESSQDQLPNARTN